MKKRRIYKAFVAAHFYNTGQPFGFATQKERDDFVEAYKGARSTGFVDVTPTQFREWQQDGYWDDYIADDGSEYIPDGGLLRFGIDNDWELERR